MTGLDESALDAPVPACPNWSVRDLVAHLTAVGEDVIEGRLTGPPSDAQTAGQVARFQGRSLREVLARWDEVTPPFEAVIDGFEVWPAVLDVATHEQDIRGAVGEPGARDAEVVRLGSDRLLTWMRPPVPLRVVVEDASYDLGPDGEPAVALRTDRFGALPVAHGPPQPAPAGEPGLDRRPGTFARPPGRVRARGHRHRGVAGRRGAAGAWRHRPRDRGDTVTKL